MGGCVPWKSLYEDEPAQIVSLPTYPFLTEHYQMVKAERDRTSEMTGPPTDAPILEFAGVKEKSPCAVAGYVTKFVSDLLNLSHGDVQPNVDLREYGLDSIGIIKLRQACERAFKIRIAGTDMLTQSTAGALSALIARKIEEAESAGTTCVGASRDAAHGSPDAETLDKIAIEALEKFRQDILSEKDIEELIEKGVIA